VGKARLAGIRKKDQSGLNTAQQLDGCIMYAALQGLCLS
jgi:hypothetical protein